MGATLSTLRKYIRAEVNDPKPSRKMSSSTLTHDGGDSAAFFQDQSFNFDSQGIEIGDVIYNTSDGGSLAVIRQITDGGATNDKLVVGSIEGGTDNDYDDGDVVYIYDRHAQRGLDGTRWTNTEVEDALAQAQKIVALRFGGVEKFDVKQDIHVVTKYDLVGTSSTFTVGETVTGGTNSHAATVLYVGTDFIVVNEFITRVPIDNVTGTFKVGEVVTGSTNSYTGVIEEVNAAYLDLYAVSGTFADNETLTGGTTSATCLVNSAAGYSSGVFASGETITGGSSSATGIIKETESANNFYLGQAMPTDVKHLLQARWWTGSNWEYLRRDHIEEYNARDKSTGDPSEYAVFDDRIWLWPNNSTKQYNEIHLFYMAWDSSLSADTDTTDFDNKVERLLVLEASKILAGQANEERTFARIVNDITLINTDIQGTDDNQAYSVRQEIEWNSGGSPFLE